jgi:hypothetical protein
MNSLLVYLIFQVLPALAALVFTLFIARIITNPIKLKKRLDKSKQTPRYEIHKKFYNKDFLRAWVCISTFFVSGIAYDIYKVYFGQTAMAFLALAITLSTVIFGGIFMSRALKH